MPRPSQPQSFHHHNIMCIWWRKKLWSSSLWNFIQSPVTSSNLNQNTLLNTLFSNTVNCFLYFGCETKFHNHTTWQAYYDGELVDDCLSFCYKVYTWMESKFYVNKLSMLNTNIYVSRLKSSWTGSSSPLLSAGRWWLLCQDVVVGVT
jgi:hypothetical protein